MPSGPFPRVERRDLLILLLTLGLGTLAVLVSFFILGPTGDNLPGQAKLAAQMLHGFWAHEVVYPLHVLALGWAGHLFLRERSSGDWKAWLLGNRWLLSGVLLASIWLQLGEPWSYRVYYDEPSHEAVARVMHLGRNFESVGSWHQPFEAVTVYNTLMPLRMGFFPFLLSLIHDLTGYRESNVYLLNALLGFLFLLVAGLLGRRLGGVRGAFFAVLAFAGLPLLAQVLNSGSYDLLALLMLSCLFLQILRLQENPSPLRQGQLLSVGLLLVLSRYEGAIYLALAGVFVLRAWWVGRRITLGFGALLFPPAVLTVGIVRDRYLEVNKNLVSSVKGSGDGMFSFSHIAENAGDTFTYLFLPDRFGTGSALLCWLGLGAFLLVLKVLLGRGRMALAALPVFWPALVFSTFVVALWAVVFLPTFWTNLTDPMASRFALPLFLVAAVLVSFAAGHLLPRRRGTDAVAGFLFLAYLAGWCLPSMLAHRATDEMLLAKVQKEWREFSRQKPSPSVLYAGESSLPHALQGYSSTLTVVLNRTPDRLRHLFALGIYDEAYVMERFSLDPATGKRNYGLGTRPAPNWQMTPELLREVSPGLWIEISRLRGFTPDDGSAPWKLARSARHEEPPFETEEDWSNYVRGFLLSEI